MSPPIARISSGENGREVGRRRRDWEEEVGPPRERLLEVGVVGDCK